MGKAVVTRVVALDANEGGFLSLLSGIEALSCDKSAILIYLC